jgi:predicted phage-related endonuclease
MSVTFKSNEGLSKADWVHSRNNTLGASEVATVVVGSKFTCNLELYYNKIGLGRPLIPNIRMSIGTKTEPMSIHYWKHYEGSEKSIIANEERGRIVKDCIYENNTYFNSKYPHLSATPDAIILPFGVYAGKGKGCLEIKNTNGFVMQSYSAGLPTQNLFQVATQMMVTEYAYSELYYFIDNSRFECHPLLRKDTKKMEDAIIIHTTDFWDRVIKARVLANQMFEFKRVCNMKAANEAMAEIERLEPPAQNTSGFLDYLTERFKDRASGAGIIKGTDEQYAIAKRHLQLKSKIDKLNKEKELMELQLKSAMRNAVALDFGKDGKVFWELNSNNNRIFKNKTK